MADARRGRGRTLLLWLVSVALVALVLLARDDDRAPPPPAPEPASPDEKLRIVELSDAEVTPGSAVVVQLHGADATRPLAASFSQQNVKRDGEVLSRGGDSLVVRVPPELQPGKASVRLVQADRRSKPHDLLVRPINRGKLVRNLLGGLALLVLGLRFLGAGLRGLAGHRVRDLLAKITRGSPRAVAMGALVGALTQLTTSAAGLTVGLLQSRLLALPAAIALLLGAQLGAAATGAVLPVTYLRDSLLVIVVGVTWVSLAVDRRDDAVGHAVLGAGLLFYGLHLLHVGFQPLVDDPEILAWVRHLRGGGVRSFVACAGVGALLAALLQGPGPVFALVVGLLQISGAFSLANGLAILAGTAAGCAAGALLVAWPSGRDARRLALANAALGLASTIVMLAGVRAFAGIADAIVPGDPAEMVYGKRILLPRMDAHLAVGFVMAQATATGLCAAALPWIARIASRRPAAHDDDASPSLVGLPRIGADAAVAIAGGRLAEALQHQRQALDGTLAMLRAGDRGGGVAAEHALADGRAEVEKLYVALAPRADAEGERLRRAVVAALQLQRAIEDLLRLGERGVQRGVSLSAADREALAAAHALALEGLDAITGALARGRAVDIEAARAREIRMNAGEAAARRSLTRAARKDGDESGTLRLHVAELLDAYESVGNHVYRACEALAANAGEDLA